MTPSARQAVEALAQGRESHAGRAWKGAYEALSQADRGMPLEAAYLELLATSAYMVAPGFAAELDPGITRLHSADYRSPAQLSAAVRFARDADCASASRAAATSSRARSRSAP